MAWPARLEIDGRNALSRSQRVKPAAGRIHLGARDTGEPESGVSMAFLAGMPQVEFTHEFEAGKTYVFEMTGEARFFTTRSAIREVEWRTATERLRACCRYVPAQRGSF
jgi:hypothetical protein